MVSIQTNKKNCFSTFYGQNNLKMIKAETKICPHSYYYLKSCVFPRERHADTPPLLKVAELSFWSQKTRNVLQHMQNNFSVFLYACSKSGAYYVMTMDIYFFKSNCTKKKICG